MIKAVAFDLDDTLYDEVEYCKSGFKAVAKFLANSIGTAPAEEIFGAVWKQFTAGNHTQTFNAALDQLDIPYDHQLIQSLIKAYRDHVPHISLPADSRIVLEQLSAKYTLALLTDGFLPAQELKAQALGIEKYFKCIVYTEKLGRQYWKPSPAGFQELIEHLKLKPENTAYVADNEKKDFIAPNKLGFATIRIIRPAAVHKESSDQPDAPAKYVIRKITELPHLLETL